jgi:hypothetical protein
MVKGERKKRKNVKEKGKLKVKLMFRAKYIRGNDDGNNVHNR